MADDGKELKIQGPTSKASPAVYLIVNSQVLLFIQLYII